MTESNNLDPQKDPRATEDHLEELSEQLNEALESMRRGESPKQFSADPAFQAAVKLHALTSESTPDEATQKRIEQRVLEQCAAPEHAREHRWRYWFVPLVSAGAVAVVVFIMSTGTGTGPLTIALQNINTAIRGNTERNDSTAGNTQAAAQPAQTAGQIAPAQAFLPVSKTLLADADALTDANITEEIADLSALEQDLNAGMQDLQVMIDQLDALQDADTNVESADTALLQLSSL